MRIAEEEGELVHAAPHLGRGRQRRVNERDGQLVVERGSSLPVSHVLVVDAVKVVVFVVFLLLFLLPAEKNNKFSEIHNVQCTLQIFVAKNSIIFFFVLKNNFFHFQTAFCTAFARLLKKLIIK